MTRRAKADVLVVLDDPPCAFGCQGLLDTGCGFRDGWRVMAVTGPRSRCSRRVEQRDAVGLFQAACGAGAAGAQRGGDGGELGGGGLPFGQGQVEAVQVGDAAALAPQDLGGGLLPAGAQAAGAQLPDGEQVLGCPVVGVGGQPVAGAVGVVELDVDAAGAGAVEHRHSPGQGSGNRVHGVRVLSMGVRTGRGRAGLGKADRPRAVFGMRSARMKCGGRAWARG